MDMRNEADWRSTLPEEWLAPWRGDDGREREIPLREHPGLAKYRSKDEAVKALVHAQRLLGRREAEAPAQPRGLEDYELPDLLLDEDFEPDQGVLDAYKAKALELALTQDQVRGLYEWFVPMNVAAVRASRDKTRKAREAELGRLRKNHGPEASRVLESARRAAMSLGGEELLEILESTGAGDSAVVAEALARVAPLLLEGRMRDSGAREADGLTLDRLREMIRDPRYFDPSRRDPAFVRQVDEGFKHLYPGPASPVHGNPERSGLGGF